MAEKYGKELSLKERTQNNIFGIGFFKPEEGQPNVLSEWFKLKNHTIRPHLDQLTKGLIVRLIGTKEVNALGIGYNEIAEIRISKLPDTVNAVPLSPFWVLIQLGFKPRNVRWFSRHGFTHGDCEVFIQLKASPAIKLIWQGNHETEVRSFFKSKFLYPKVVDKQSH